MEESPSHEPDSAGADPWYVVVAAIFPALFLFAHNYEQTPPRDLIAPLGAALSGATLLFISLLAARRIREVAGVITLTATVTFFAYGHVTDTLLEAGLPLRQRWALPLAALFVCGAALWAWRHERFCRAATRPLNVFSVLLLALTLVTLGRAAGRQRAALASTGAGSATLPGSDGAQRAWADAAGSSDGPRRNVYYIILDGYGRDDILLSHYRYDNSAFLRYLESRGFQVNRRSYANYSTTFLSLASSLSGEHLTPLARPASGTHDRTPAYEMIHHSGVALFLKERGYRIVNVGSGWGPTQYLRAADENIGCPAASEFADVLMRNTMAWPFVSEAFSSYSARLCQIRLLREVADDQGPRFVLAHILLPHPPYYFGPNGERRKTSTALGDDRSWTNVKGYTDQLTFVNTTMMGVIDTILERDRSDPIIVLQSDHGTASTGGADERDPAYARERMPILNAVRLPGVKGVSISRFTSPVNTFGAIFELYFGARATPVADASYLSSHPYYFYFVRVDSVLR